MNYQHSDKQITLTELISEGQWATIDALLAPTSSAPSSSTEILIDDPSHTHALTSNVIIHFASRAQAPLSIIALLSRKFPESLSSTDAAGRYPVHVAAKWGATPDVIQFLLKTNISFAGVPDNSGRTPLHYVGEHYLTNYNSLKYDRDQAQLYVVKMLKMVAPRSVNIEDEEGMNAIEYALESDASLIVIKAMQRACRDDWRERSTAGAPLPMVKEEDNFSTDTLSKPTLGRRRHKDMLKDIQIMTKKMQRANRISSGWIHSYSTGTNSPALCVARTA